jgi:hypothetical protein
MSPAEGVLLRPVNYAVVRMTVGDSAQPKTDSLSYNIRQMCVGHFCDCSLLNTFSDTHDSDWK